MSARTAVVRGGAVWVAGKWVDEPEGLASPPPPATPDRAALGTIVLGAGDRIPRADRYTQLGALVVARAVHGLPAMSGEAVSVLTVSTLASSHTNERFELRRLSGRPPEPRSFPYTAPNAMAGELAIALGARGPCVALVGDGAVGAVGLARAAAWLSRGDCQRAILVAVECPPEHPERVSPPGIAPAEAVVALVLEREGEGRSLTVEWHALDAEAPTSLLSVDALAWALRGTSLQLRAGRTFASGAGAAVRIRGDVVVGGDSNGVGSAPCR